MKKINQLSETELEIMEVLWQSKEEVSFKKLLEYFNLEKNKNWKSQTLATFITRLAKKEFITWEQVGRTKFYKPILSLEEYDSKKAKSMLDILYSGSVKRFIVSLYNGKCLSEEDISELKKWLEDK